MNCETDGKHDETVVDPSFLCYEPAIGIMEWVGTKDTYHVGDKKFWAVCKHHWFSDYSLSPEAWKLNPFKGCKRVSQS